MCGTNGANRKEDGRPVRVFGETSMRRMLLLSQMDMGIASTLTVASEDVIMTALKTCEEDNLKDHLATFLRDNKRKPTAEELKELVDMAKAQTVQDYLRKDEKPYKVQNATLYGVVGKKGKKRK
jgi:hypothetical protein